MATNEASIEYEYGCDRIIVRQDEEFTDCIRVIVETDEECTAALLDMREMAGFFAAASSLCHSLPYEPEEA